MAAGAVLNLLECFLFTSKKDWKGGQKEKKEDGVESKENEGKRTRTKQGIKFYNLVRTLY